MPIQFIYDMDNLLKEIDSFYLKYGEDNTEKVENVRNAINYLKSLNFNYVDDISNIKIICKKLEIMIKNLNVILRKLSDILFNYYEDYRYYPILRKYLINRNYYSQEDRNKAFQNQLQHNDYDIYLISGLKLVNLFDKNKIISFATEEDLQRHIENSFYTIIKPKTDNFEEEFKKYYDYLLLHGYNYSTNEYYDPYNIAAELTSLFGGKVMEYGTGIPIYSKSFKYPDDFSNEEYLEKLSEFLRLHHDKKFVKDYRKMRLIEMDIQAQIDRLYAISENYNNIINKLRENANNISLGNEILFLQKCYTAYAPKYGYGEYKYIDYYKALDAEWLRKMLNDNSIAAWKTGGELKHQYDRDYNVCVWEDCFNWSQYTEVKSHNRELENELNSMDYSSSEDIEDIIKNKYIIEANSKLDYDTLLNEYYSNFGMNPKDFVGMVQSKYGCKVVCPNRKSQSTKIILKKPVQIFI